MVYVSDGVPGYCPQLNGSMLPGQNTRPGSTTQPVPDKPCAGDWTENREIYVWNPPKYDVMCLCVCVKPLVLMLLIHIIRYVVDRGALRGANVAFTCSLQVKERKARITSSPKRAHPHPPNTHTHTMIVPVLWLRPPAAALCQWRTLRASQRLQWRCSTG